MKGWFDRVLTLGFAYSEEKPYSLEIFKVKDLHGKGSRICSLY